MESFKKGPSAMTKMEEEMAWTTGTLWGAQHSAEAALLVVQLCSQIGFGFTLVTWYLFSRLATQSYSMGIIPFPF